MGKLLILSVTDHEEHILNKIMELIADEPEFIHLAPSLPQSALSFPGLEIRLKEQTVYCNSTLIALTYHEFSVLTYLAQGPSWLGYPGAWLRHLLSASTFRLRYYCPFASVFIPGINFPYD